MGKVSPIGSAHRYLSANNANNQQKKGEYVMKKGEGSGVSWLYVLKYTFSGAWAFDNPMTELTWAPIKADFYSRNRTKNLGSDDADDGAGGGRYN